jgi:hypothetical protein
LSQNVTEWGASETAQRELLADHFQRVFGVHADAEAHAQHAFLARRQ